MVFARRSPLKMVKSFARLVIARGPAAHTGYYRAWLSGNLKLNQVVNAVTASLMSVARSSARATRQLGACGIAHRNSVTPNKYISFRHKFIPTVDSMAHLYLNN